MSSFFAHTLRLRVMMMPSVRAMICRGVDDDDCFMPLLTRLRDSTDAGAQDVDTLRTRALILLALRALFMPLDADCYAVCCFASPRDADA